MMITDPHSSCRQLEIARDFPGCDQTMKVREGHCRCAHVSLLRDVKVMKRDTELSTMTWSQVAHMANRALMHVFKLVLC